MTPPRRSPAGHGRRGRLASLLVLGLLATTTTAGAAAPAVAAPPVLGTAPQFSLTDPGGATFGTGDLAGKVWAANFVFTTCRMTCPAQTQRLALLAETLAPELAADRLELVSFTVDPERDRPEVLRAYAEKTGADPAAWHFLTGERAELWRISAEGFRLPVGDSPEPAGGPLFHSPQVVVVDAAGRIRGYFDGLSPEGMAAAEAAIRTLLAEAPAATARRVTEDPEILDPPWLAERGAAQVAALADLDLRTDFRFTDRQPESGLAFRHEPTPDGAESFKVVHYDHGNGLATADVDGDGHLDLYLTSQVGPNRLFRGRGDGTFEDVTVASGTALAESVKVSASFADVDNDGDPDLFVTSTRGGNVLLENDGEGHFRDITREAGLDYVGHSSVGVFFDYDNDGLLDLYLANVGKFTTEQLAPAGNERLGGEREYWYYVAYDDAFSGHLKPERHERSRLYRNLGGNRFADVTAAVGLDDVAWTGDALAADFDEDGWSDLYVLNMQGHDEYYRNVEGKRFERASREVFPKTPWGSMGAQVLDWDRDGRLDLFVTDMHSDMMEDLPPTLAEEKRKANQRWPESLLRSGGQSLYGNAFFHQQPDGSFAEISDRVGAEVYWPWGLSVGDLNADGWPDAFVTASMNFKWRYHPNAVLLNDRGRRWVDAEFALGVEPRRDGRTAKPWFTLDCDGPDREHPECRKEGRSGRIELWDALGSRSSLLVDLETDGDLDVVTNDFGSEPLVLYSDLAQTHPDLCWLRVELEGTRSNRDGLGARVTVRTADGAQHQLHDGRSGYLSQSVQPLYFGLGAAQRVEAVEVRWPSGTVQMLPGPIAANQLLRIVEPTPGPASP